MSNDSIYIPRHLENLIDKWLFKDMVIVLYGARRVGKTTLIKNLCQKYGREAEYYNCDLPEIRRVLEEQNPINMKNYIGEKNW